MVRLTGQTSANCLGGATVAVLLFAFVHASAGAESPGCVVDDATGVPMSRSSHGICVEHTADRTFIVQSSSRGLLIASTEYRQNDIVSTDPAGSTLLHLYGREADLIFCPAGTLDRMTGAPSDDCLWDLPSMSPGRAALVGTGQVFASAVLDVTGSALCPTALTVLADATSPGGDEFDLTSSVILSPTEKIVDGTPVAVPGCAVSRREVELSYRWGDAPNRELVDSDIDLAPGGRERDPGSLAAELGWLNELSDEDWRLVSGLVRLDESDWRLLHRLLSLEENEIRALGEELAANGAAMITDDGRVVQDTGAGAAGGSGTAVTKEEVESILDEIYNIVIYIRNKVSSISSVVNSVSGRIPNRADIRALVGDATDITNLGEVIQRVREIIGGMLAVAAALRDGFDSWYGGGCGPSTECAAFKADLVGLLGDVRDGAEFIQSVSCLDQPGREIRTLDTSLVEDLVINRAPAVVLYSLYLVLERIAPSKSGGGWRSIVSDVLDEIPTGFRSDLLELCARDTGESIGGSSGLVCRLLTQEEVGISLNVARAVAKRKAMVAKVIDSFLKDDVVAQGGAVAGGGGSAGTNVKNPAKVVSKQAEDIADDLPDNIKDIIDKRDQCLEAADNIEDGLRDCQPPISVFLDMGTSGVLPPHPTFSDVVAVVNRRVQFVAKCQVQGSCRDLDLSNAQQYLEDARSRAATVEGYSYLCCAYQALNGGTAHTCPPP